MSKSEICGSEFSEPGGRGKKPGRCCGAYANGANQSKHTCTGPSALYKRLLHHPPPPPPTRPRRRPTLARRARSCCGNARPGPKTALRAPKSKYAIPTNTHVALRRCERRRGRAFPWRRRRAILGLRACPKKSTNGIKVARGRAEFSAEKRRSAAIGSQLGSQPLSLSAVGREKNQ